LSLNHPLERGDIEGTEVSFVHVNLLNAELKPTCYLLALFGAHHVLHVSRMRVNCGPIRVKENGFVTD